MRPNALFRWAFCMALLSAAVTQSASAEDAVVQQTNVDADSEEAPEGPSAFESGYQGLLAGAVTGAAGGYLFGRRGDWERSDWRAVGLGIGIGSLTGAGIGIALGIAGAGGAPGGRYVARDLLAGAGFGATVGAISGGISAIINSDAEHVLAGAAIGTLAGAGLGIITGIVQGQRQESETRTTTTTAGFSLTPTLAMARDVRGSSALMPTLAGRF